MTQNNSRTREQYKNFLESRIASTEDETVRLALEASVATADGYDRSISPLASLARLVEACDAIESGEAASLAQQLGKPSSAFRRSGSPLNGSAVEAYVRLRSAQDQAQKRSSEWGGPRRETIARSEYLAKYLVARQDAATAKPRPGPGSRARRLEEIVGSLSRAEDRQDLRFALEKGSVAQRELAILRKSIETNFPAVSIDQLLGKISKPQPSATFADLSENQRQALAKLKNKLKDNEQLRHFGMATDGRRVKIMHNGAHFLEKAEYDALMTLLDEASKPQP